MILSVLAAIESESDREFMERLYRTHYAVLYRKARRYVPNPQDAEDVVAMAILRLIDHIDLLRARDAFTQRSYLLSTVKNVALDRLRRQKRLPEYTFDDVDERLAAVPSDETVDSALLRNEQALACADALRSLPERDRELLRMKYYDELPDREIARLLGCRSDSVRTLLTRARRKMRAIIAEVDTHE